MVGRMNEMENQVAAYKATIKKIIYQKIPKVDRNDQLEKALEDYESTIKSIHNNYENKINDVLSQYNVSFSADYNRLYELSPLEPQTVNSSFYFDYTPNGIQLSDTTPIDPHKFDDTIDVPDDGNPLVLEITIITVGYFIYKRFLSKAARVCSRKRFSEKSLCMKIYKIKAIEERIKHMKNSISYCKHSKSPSKCTNKIIKRIQSLEKRKKRIW